ncbi:MAG: flagellar basal-body rod protein FlgG [Defluviitaleaceae bacterium]|nr:flagellar basal-body rod protein FlgG [Defluviitaleaceae bacterium]
MMRSLWTAAAGMTSQQQNVDTISNNLANVNTYGYKRERLEFKSLLYQTMQRADLDPSNQTGRPVNLQVGLGVRPIATARIFTPGNYERTEQSQDFAIEGDGFFVVSRGEGDEKYTKDGSFKISAGTDGLTFVTSEGWPVMGVDGSPVTIPPGIALKDISVDSGGAITYSDADGATVDLGMQFQLVQFANPQGLEAVGSNLYGLTPASGQPLVEADGDTGAASILHQGVLEMSNVQVAEEMINLIVAQRAYDLNSRAISTSDDMLQTANNMKR